MRNSTFTPNAIYHLSTCLSNASCYITALSFKFTYLGFDELLMLADGIKFNKTLVKLDLSHNCFKSCMMKFMFEALLDNSSVADLNLSSNFLDNEFAVDLAHLLESNQQLHKVDIASNPIGPEGAKYLLESILAHNDTLESLGDIRNTNVYMGVRLCEEI
jgi:Ran GTPase-activating protein (RanGAP) involved in mRNA processing and transport